MNNSTLAADVVESPPPTVTEDVIIGFLYFISCVIIAALYLPCMIVMVKVKDLWKNACIQVCVCVNEIVSSYCPHI
jgi:hypothetical protein